MKTARLGATIALAGLLWVALAAWALMSPVGAAPDDDYHLAMIYCAAGEADCVPEGQREGPCFTMRPEVPASCSDWGSRTLPETDGINTEHYPPFYYLAMSPLTGPTLADTTVSVRLANVTLAVVMMLGSVALTAPRLRRSLAFSWPIAAVPLGMYFIASTNPSAWAIIGFAAIWGPLLTHLTAPGGAGSHWAAPHTRGVTIARWAFVLLAAFVAVAGRTEGALFLPLVVAALAVFALPGSLKGNPSGWWRRLLLPLVLVGLAVVFLWLYARPKAETVNPGGGQVGDNYTGWAVVQHTVNSFLGTVGMPGVPGSGLGTYDVPVPALAAVLIVFAYGAAALFGLGSIYGRKAVALTVFGSGAVTATAVLWSRENWEYFQPRYFLPLSFVWLGLLLLPWPDTLADRSESPAAAPGMARDFQARANRPTSLQSGLILAAVGLANALAMLSTIQRFQRGVVPQPSRDPLTPAAPTISPSELAGSAIPNWWWPSIPLDPLTVWTSGSVAWALGLILVWSLQRQWRS